MSKESIALKWFSEYLDHPISHGEVAYESYVFEVNELDTDLIPNEYSNCFKLNQEILTHLYVYDESMVYFFEPLGNDPVAVTLIGLSDNYELVRYELRIGGI